MEEDLRRTEPFKHIMQAAAAAQAQARLPSLRPCLGCAWAALPDPPCLPAQPQAFLPAHDLLPFCALPARSGLRVRRGLWQSATRRRSRRALRQAAHSPPGPLRRQPSPRSSMQPIRRRTLQHRRRSSSSRSSAPGAQGSRCRRPPGLAAWPLLPRRCGSHRHSSSSSSSSSSTRLLAHMGSSRARLLPVQWHHQRQRQRRRRPPAMQPPPCRLAKRAGGARSRCRGGRATRMCTRRGRAAAARRGRAPRCQTRRR